MSDDMPPTGYAPQHPRDLPPGYTPTGPADDLPPGYGATGPADDLTQPAVPDDGSDPRQDGQGRRNGRRGGRRRGSGPAARPASGRRLAPRPPGTRRYLVLGDGSLTDDVAALDLDTGVVARLHGGLPVVPDGTIQPFDVVDGMTSAPGLLDDPSRPEAVLVSGQLQRAGVSRGRSVRRLLKAMVAPPEPHLLGFPGSSWPYWELSGDRPSVAVVTPSRGPLLFRRQEDGSAWVRFGWYRTDNWLPLQDPRAQAVLAASAHPRLSGKSLVTALGFRPAYLVVAVGLPRNGYCTKIVLALLPRA